VELSFIWYAQSQLPFRDLAIPISDGSLPHFLQMTMYRVARQSLAERPPEWSLSAPLFLLFFLFCCVVGVTAGKNRAVAPACSIDDPWGLARRSPVALEEAMLIGSTPEDRRRVEKGERAMSGSEGWIQSGTQLVSC